ncbi:hypothetical protein [Ruegeria arenilitoris]|uniref:hypothetical protein n=1 Tax=Ruegeria arenilitoris TaxID=1173585 RepID=UPI00147DD614|nr:hypothetical protein [Ruegeria arenilitoris]
MSRRHPIWYGIGVTIIPLVVLIVGYFNIHPEIYRGIPQGFGSERDSSRSGIAWDEDEKEDPPLEYVSDSFEGLYISTERVSVTSFWSLWNAPSSEIGYEWRYQVKNLTDDDLRISVEYELVGKHDRVFARSDAYEDAEPGETVEISGKGRIDYFDARQVLGSSWGIRRRPVPGS